MDTRMMADAERFGFGENWTKFLAGMSDERVSRAEQSLRDKLGMDSLEGVTFLDVGSGSGLFSLAARRLGARVKSFDYDIQSVACTNELKSRYFAGDPEWTVERGSVLDQEYLRTLGLWDVVYSWGVLHHTGDLWSGLSNVAGLVSADGHLFVAIYNDQGRRSRSWLRVKKIYNRMPSMLRWAVLAPATAVLWGPATLRDLLTGNPFRTWRSYGGEAYRGMSPWTDVRDWVGGLPFEVATPHAVFRFFRDRGFVLKELETCGGGIGCNEFVFERSGRAADFGEPRDSGRVSTR